MSTKMTVISDKAPAAVGPYSQACWAGDLLYLSGQLGLDPATGQLVGPDVTAQAHQIMANLTAVLAAAGLGLDDLVKTTIYLTDMGDFGAVNEIYADYFKNCEHLPARACVQVAALPLGGIVEIEGVAMAS